MDAVEHVLEQRARLGRGSRLTSGLAAAALLHAAAFALAFFVASWHPPARPMEFVPVTLLPAQALGVERPRARPRPQAAAPTPPAPPPPAAAEPPPKPAPKPQAPAPKPPPEEKPIRRETEHEIPPEVERRPALKNVQKESLPKPERARPERPTRESGRGSATEKAPGRRTPERAAAPSRGPAGPGGLADIGKGDEIGRRGSATGNPLGSSAFGSSIAGLEDPDFGYGYYIDRLLQLIDANWTRPAVGGEVRAVVFFRIQKSGQIADLRIEQPSGYNAFDLAALRAVQNAAPFPALPASYRHDSLGVNLIVH